MSDLVRRRCLVAVMVTNSNITMAVVVVTTIQRRQTDMIMVHLTQTTTTTDHMMRMASNDLVPLMKALTVITLTIPITIMTTHFMIQPLQIRNSDVIGMFTLLNYFFLVEILRHFK